METKTAAMSDATVRQMISLLKDPVFCGLRVLADERPLTREEFEMLAMPEGVSREQTWDILNALRRQTAVELPFRDGEGRRGWYYPTRSIVANLDDIDKRCHAGSWLDLAVRSRNATYFLVEAHVDEAVATLKEDGLSIGYEKAREVLLSERDPETSEERLLLNWHRTAWHLEELAGRPCLHARDRPRGVRTGFARRGAPGHPFVATGFPLVEAQAARSLCGARARVEDHRGE